MCILNFIFVCLQREEHKVVARASFKMPLGEPVDVSEAQDGGILKVQFLKNYNLLSKNTP